MHRKYAKKPAVTLPEALCPARRPCAIRARRAPDTSRRSPRRS